jgi:hypothetical protein
MPVRQDFNTDNKAASREEDVLSGIQDTAKRCSIISNADTREAR